jgi:hypothetical protein
LAAIADPTLLDALDGSPLNRNVSIAEESSAAWLDDDRIVIGGSSEAEDPEETLETDREHPGPRLRPNGLSIFDIPSRSHVQSVGLGYPPGTMMAAGAHHVVTFFRRPRLISLTTGKIAHEWSDIDSGEAVSSIVRDLPCPPRAGHNARTLRSGGRTRDRRRHDRCRCARALVTDRRVDFRFARL